MPSPGPAPPCTEARVVLDQLGGFVNTSCVWTSDSGAVVFVLAVPLSVNPSERELTQEAGSRQRSGGLAAGMAGELEDQEG